MKLSYVHNLLFSPFREKRSKLLQLREQLIALAKEVLSNDNALRSLFLSRIVRMCIVHNLSRPMEKIGILSLNTTSSLVQQGSEFRKRVYMRCKRSEVLHLLGIPQLMTGNSYRPRKEINHIRIIAVNCIFSISVGLFMTDFT